MKKFPALLCVVMLLLGVTAQAETCFSVVKSYISTYEDADGNVLGDGYTTTHKEKNGYMGILFDIPRQAIYVSGDNNAEGGESVLWVGVNAVTFFELMIICCSGWDTLENALDSGYTMYITILSSDDEEDRIVLTSSEEASTFSAALKSMIDE